MKLIETIRIGESLTPGEVETFRQHIPKRVLKELSNKHGISEPTAYKIRNGVLQIKSKYLPFLNHMIRVVNVILDK